MAIEFVISIVSGASFFVLCFNFYPSFEWLAGSSDMKKKKGNHSQLPSSLQVGEGEQEGEKTKLHTLPFFKWLKLEAGVAVYTSTSEQTLTRAATEKLN